MAGLRESNDESMMAAWEAGMDYWQRNRPENSSRDSLELLARSCGWHGEDRDSWLAGFYGARRRMRDQ